MAHGFDALISRRGQFHEPAGSLMRRLNAVTLTTNADRIRAGGSVCTARAGAGVVDALAVRESVPIALPERLGDEPEHQQPDDHQSGRDGAGRAAGLSGGEHAGPDPGQWRQRPVRHPVRRANGSHVDHRHRGLVAPRRDALGPDAAHGPDSRRHVQRVHGHGEPQRRGPGRELRHVHDRVSRRAEC